MFLENLSIVNFKNLESKSFDFDAKINCFVGNNGIGKTTVLDAIYYMSFAKSYFNPIASQNIRHGESFFMLEGLYKINDRNEKILCSMKKGQKKILKRNDKSYDKISEHIGQFPLVIISPSDRDLITEGSETRRKFIDGVISQQDKNYLHDLLSYGKTVSQRNALLKYFALNRTFDEDNLNIYNEQLINYGTRIYEKRKEFLKEFTPIFNEKYKLISGDKEDVSLTYKSQLHDFSFEELLKNSLEKDRLVQYSCAGIHKDDLNFEISTYPIKKFGSQGQQKTFLIALKLAQFDFIKKQKDLNPLLLLDDIFDKLDEHRVEHIINMVNKDGFGQIFITDTHAERTENVIKKSGKSYKMYHLT